MMGILIVMCMFIGSVTFLFALNMILEHIEQTGKKPWE